MKSDSFVVPIATARDSSLVGGKAINLARLMAAGLPVPDGFVVTTAAFRASGESGEIPREVAECIRLAYEQMGSPMVAARSSATAEDLAEASMAGQYDTFLNLTGIDAVLDGVVRCWKSLQSDRLRAYLKEQGIAPESVAMAVVVQRLVPADAAGVLFTADPQTGSTDEMLVEAAWGLGEGVVSGKVQPDRIRLRAEDGRVVHYQVAEKNSRLDPGKQEFESVTAEDRMRACLRAESLQQLWELGRRAARSFDGPQDMEWAVVNGQVHVLQSRNITTLREASLRHGLPNAIRQRLSDQLASGRGPWVRHNMDETLPHPTPLTWSILKPFMSGSGGFGRMYALVGFQPSEAVHKEGFLELLAGRIYMDCARMPEMFSTAYPFAYDLEMLKANPDAAQQPPSVPTGSLRDQGEAAQQAQRVTDWLRQEAKDLDHRFDNEFVPEVMKWCNEENQRDLTQLTNGTLISLWESRRTKVLDEFGVMAFLPSMIEALATSDLHAFLDEHAWDEDPDTLLHQLVVGQKPDQTFLSNSRLQEVGCGKRSREEWLAEFGARGPGEFDLSSPRWRERPEDIDAMAARLANESSLEELHARRCENSVKAMDQLRSLRPHLIKELEQRVELVNRYVRFREDGKHYLMQAYSVLRQTALEFGRRLEIGDEVFLLKSNEMTEALITGYIPKDRIIHRRFLRNAENSISLPRVIDAESLSTLGVPVVAADATRWAAHPLSPGTGSGIARIVHSPESAGDLGKNYILICPSTDPSWTPLFVGASGLILERGGTLSHGAIVARELGLPAVVLEKATQLFDDGESLTLDAYGGQVIRGASVDTRLDELSPDNPRVERSLQPPPVGTRERAAGRLGLLALLIWSVFLLAVWLLPAQWLQEPLFATMDALLWPLVPRLGMPGTVAVIAGFFAVMPLLLQKFFTDNDRVVAARNRAAKLRKLARGLLAGSARRQAVERLAAPVTMRVLKSSLTALALVLGPMILVFLWLPARLDPASWNAAAGQTVTILAEVKGDWPHPITLHPTPPLEIDSISPASQTLPPIRSTLQGLRAEWTKRSDVTAYPWELQAAADHVHEVLMSSLDSYLAGEIPSQKISWRVNVPEDAEGHHQLTLQTESAAPSELTLAFGNLKAPAVNEIMSPEGPIYSLKAVYPRALQKNTFWTPLKASTGIGLDFGWLGVYLLAYLPLMVIVKRLLRVA